MKLFQRLAGRLVPTPAAEALFPEAERLHHGLEGFRRFAADLRQGKAGMARLAASAPAALSFVPTALDAFRQACPGVRLLSYVVPAEVIAQMLDRGEADLGIAMNDRARPGAEAEAIAHTRIVCVMPQGHRMGRRKAISVADLKTETVITYRADSLPGPLLHQAFAREGATLRPGVEIAVSIIAPSFVQQGFGVALVDGLLPWMGIAGPAMRPFEPDIVLPILLLVSTRRPISTTQQKLRQHLRDAVRDYAALPTARGLLRPVQSAP